MARLFITYNKCNDFIGIFLFKSIFTDAIALKIILIQPNFKKTVSKLELRVKRNIIFGDAKFLKYQPVL